VVSATGPPPLGDDASLFSIFTRATSMTHDFPGNASSLKSWTLNVLQRFAGGVRRIVDGSGERSRGRCTQLTRRALVHTACFVGVLLPSPLPAQGWGTMVDGGISRVAQDGSNRLWGMVDNERNMLHFLTAEGWGRRELPGYHHLYRSVAVERFINGDVGCLWHNDKVTTKEIWLLSRHFADRSRPAKIFSATLRDPAMLGLDDGRVVITDSSPTFVTVFPDNKESEVITLPERLFIPPEKKEGDGVLTNDHVPLRALADASAGVWLWSPEVRHDPARWRLGGLVKLGATLADRQLFRPGEGTTLVSAVVSWDGRQLAVAVVGTGVFLLNTSTLEFNPMPVPDAEAFKYVEQLFHDGTAWHAVTMPQPSEFEPPPRVQYGKPKPVPRKVFYDRTKPTCALWRHEGGVWKLLHDGLDKDPAMSRPWLRIPSGLFVGSDVGPPWFFPADGAKPRRIAAPSAFPLASVEQMFNVDARQLLFHNGEARTTCLWPAAATATGEQTLRWEKLDVVGKPLRDARGHIWCLRQDNTLTRWDGSAWRKFPSPPLGAVSVSMGFFSDDRDRGWLLPAGNDPTAICDFTTGEWREFPTLRDALEAQLAHPMTLDLAGRQASPPVFSKDGRIGIFTRFGNIALYENRAWREWRISEITGVKNSAPVGNLFFASDGKLSVPFTGEIVWQWHDDGKGWQKTSGIPVPQADSAATSRPERGVRDNQGTVWLLRRGNSLARFVSGREVNVFDAKEPNPFERGGSLYGAVVDDGGNALLDIGSTGYGRTQLFIRARLPGPASTVQLARTSEASAHLKIGADDSPVLYSWKLDAGKWQGLRETSELVLENLLPGRHTVEVRTFNAELTPSKPVTLSFEITGATAEQFETLLRQLASSDLDEREAAVRKLKSQGPAILPRLVEERKTASPEVQWWLDAIIQHIERSPAAASK
jgi:hypothetical protein